MDKQGIIDYVLDTPTNTNPRILGQMLDEYTIDGGGGTSPLKIVQASIYNQLASDVVISGPFFYDSDEHETFGSISLFSGDEVIYKIMVPSDGYAQLFLTANAVPVPVGQINTTGEVEVDSSGTCNVTGDCTIRLVNQ